MKKCFKFHSDLYSKTSLIKAAYNFSDRAYLHLDYDGPYYLVTVEEKDERDPICFEDFENEMLAQNVRHEIYLQTKEIREILTARAMATSVVLPGVSENSVPSDSETEEASFSEEDILRDWFE